MNETLFKLLGLLLTSFWWLPVMRLVVNEAWRVADEWADERPDPHSLSAAHKRASEGWSAANAADRNPINSSWSIGRRQVIRRQQAFANHSQSGISSTSFGRRRS